MNKQKVEIVYRHFELPVEFPLVALTGGNWTTKPGPIENLHFHNCMEIGLLKKGRGYVYTETTKYEVEAPAVIIMPPNTLHTTTANEGCVCEWNWIYTNIVKICTDLSPGMQSAIGAFQHELNGACGVIRGTEHANLYAILTLLCEEMAGKEKDYRAVARCLQSAAAVMFLRLARSEGQSHSDFGKLATRLTPAVRYISEHYTETIRIDTLAECCHISTSHFRRLFRQVFERSPLEYIEHIRIEHACEQLYNCDYSVMQISEMNGFATVSSLDRQFARRYGLSPSQWRKKVRSVENPKVTEFLNETKR